VLVFGAGIIGLHAIQCLRATGFTGLILVVARHGFQAEWAKKMGASHIIGSDIYHEIARHTKARLLKPVIGPPVLEGGVDLVFDCVGSSATIDASLRVTRKRGKVVVVGTAATLNKVDASALWFKEVQLTGSAMFGTTTVLGKRQRTYQHVIDMLADGRLKG
jgi:threonine dehydrogenase-like Zn-dependent dehydrogenase